MQIPDNTWKQYRFTMGSPDAEAKFKAEIASAQALDKNARSYPILYVSHHDLKLTHH
jgi:ubiquitin-conjugating enzyme E2 Q